MSHPTSSTLQNVLSSLVVFVIAVPLSLGIALASGMPPTSALIAAVVGGMIIGLLSGAPLVVSGPAAGLSALVLNYVQQYGVSSLYRITALVGIVQLLFGLFKLGKLINKIPKPVLEGVLSAIGLVILLGQLHVLLGHKMPGGPIVNITSFPSGVLDSLGNVPKGSLPAFLLGLLALAIQLGWGPYVTRVKGFPAIRSIPAALPATIIATVVSLSFEIPRVHIEAIVGHAMTEWSHALDLSTWEHWMSWLGPVFGLALVASAETLLTARALQIVADQRGLKTSTHLEKELIAQGCGNFISGLFGGMPMTGVMVRSAANVSAGATTRLSTILHGFWVLVFVSLCPLILEKIPLSVLASILVITGIRLLNVQGLIKEIKEKHEGIWLWPVTTVAILFTDLLKGLGVGLACYLITLLWSKRESKH